MTNDKYLVFVFEDGKPIQKVEPMCMSREDMTQMFAKELASIVDHWLTQIDESEDSALVPLDTPRFQVSIAVARVKGEGEDD